MVLASDGERDTFTAIAAAALEASNPRNSRIHEALDACLS